jgi:hypothetical protein
MRHHMHPRSRDGFALPMALFAMVIIGALVTGGFYVSSQEHTVSVSTDFAAQALDIAEYGLEETLTMWKSGDLGGTVGQVQTYEVRPVMHGARQLGTYQIRVIPLGGAVYMVESEGRITRGTQTAVRRVGSFVRTTGAGLPYPSAVSVFGKFSAEGNARVSGMDADSCAGFDVPGVTAVSDTLVSEGNRDRITGDPDDVVAESELDPTKLSDFGDIDLSDLIAMASKTYPSGVTLTGMAPVTTVDLNGLLVCNPIQSNWGDPLRPDPLPDPPPPCMSYFPIIYGQGNMHISTGIGQGILIVEGDLIMDGNMQFYGIVIVKGSFYTAGTGNHVGGALIVHGNSELDTQSISTGNSLVQFSSCRVQDAFNDLPIRTLASRSWVTDPPPLSGAGT